MAMSLGLVEVHNTGDTIDDADSYVAVQEITPSVQSMTVAACAAPEAPGGLRAGACEPHQSRAATLAVTHSPRVMTFCLSRHRLPLWRDRRWVRVAEEERLAGRSALSVGASMRACPLRMVLLLIPAARTSIWPALRPRFSAVVPSSRAASMAAETLVNGDLNNTEALRKTSRLPPDPAYAGRTLAIPEDEDDSAIRAEYRPFLPRDDVARSDWVAQLELSTALKMAEADLRRTRGDRVKVMVLFGSMRVRSYSRLLAFECARILFRLGCDVRVFDPTGLPVKDDVQHDQHKVRELRDLSKWSDGHVWVSPEQHGNLVRRSCSPKPYPHLPTDTAHRRPCSRTRSTGSR